MNADLKKKKPNMVDIICDDSQTVMAHGCHLSDEELDLFRQTGASLSHCPNSNIS